MIEKARAAESGTDPKSIYRYSIRYKRKNTNTRRGLSPVKNASGRPESLCNAANGENLGKRRTSLQAP